MQIDEAIRLQVVDFVYNSDRKYWIPNKAGNLKSSKNRKYCVISNIDSKLSREVNRLKESILIELGVDDLSQKDKFKNLIGVVSDGSSVHEHVDVHKGEWPHTRINILIQKPIEGGMPVIDGVEYNIEQSQCWINKASSWVHSTTIVKGSIDRIVLSLGTCISNENFNSIERDILKNYEQ